MKSLSSFIKEKSPNSEDVLLENPIIEDNGPTQTIEPAPIADIEADDIPEQVIINDYMINDSNFTGYETTEIQESIYRLATFGLLARAKSVLDLGCGRADLYSYISKTVNPDIVYYGVDVNKLMLDVARRKYPNAPNLNLLEQNYFSNEELPVCDWVLNLTNLTVPYGYHDGDAMQQFIELLYISLEQCTQGTIFVLLNDRSSYPGYYQFKVADIVNKLEEMGLRYGIDNSDDMTDIFKLVILK